MHLAAIARSKFILRAIPFAAFVFIGAAQAQPFNTPQSVVSPTPPPDTICKNCAQPYAESPHAPPANFNPVTASDAQLDFYGYPPRPDPQVSPGAYAIWMNVVSIPATRIVPKLRATSVSNGPAQIISRGTPASSDTDTGVTSKNWSSYTIEDLKNKFLTPKSYIYGSLIVPTAQQAFGRCSSTWVHSFEWVGIDGWNSTDVLQAGVEADAGCSGGTTSTFYGAWYEWFPHLSVGIDNFPIHPGDLIYVYVWSTSSTKGHYFMVDKTTNMSSALAFDAPSGVHLVGNSAEWVVERPSINGKLPTLTNYVTDAFYGAHINVPKIGEYSPATPRDGTTLSTTMVADKKDVSYATRSTEDLTYISPSGHKTTIAGTAIWFFDEGPVLATSGTTVR